MYDPFPLILISIKQVLIGKLLEVSTVQQFVKIDAAAVPHRIESISLFCSGSDLFLALL